jgi:hypothetical protein
MIIGNNGNKDDHGNNLCLDPKLHEDKGFVLYCLNSSWHRVILIK